MVLRQADLHPKSPACVHHWLCSVGGQLGLWTLCSCTAGITALQAPQEGFVVSSGHGEGQTWAPPSFLGRLCPPSWLCMCMKLLVGPTLQALQVELILPSSVGWLR